MLTTSSQFAGDAVALGVTLWLAFGNRGGERTVPGPAELGAPDAPRNERVDPSTGHGGFVRHASCSVDGMLNIGSIKPNMPVVCSEGGQFAVVDHVESDNRTLKLEKDGSGMHHYIPISWVTKIDDKVHIDRPGKQAMREWTEAA